ncbi:MAG: SEC-C domain-containing protein [Peptococcaceae bacterium]|nr:SEC-C domain-containing protein [Peptococcaceae bacterium]
MSGRDRPCPCGSGKVYQQCCGRSKNFYSLEQARWRRAGQDLRRSLGEFADQPSFAWDAARAQDLYLGCLNGELADRDDDFTMERCFEWFIFDYKLSSGRTVIETFREEHPHDLDEKEAVLLRDWARSRISLYEVTGVLPGEGLYIKDLLVRREIKVRDANAAAEIEAGNILLMRVLKVGDEYEFSTSGLALPAQYKEPLLKRLRRDRQEYFKERKTRARGWETYLKERAHRINAWVMELGLSSARSGRGAAGREAPECRAILLVEKWQDVLKSLKKSKSFRLLRELRDRSGVFRQAAAAILGRPRSPDGPAAEEAPAKAGKRENSLFPVLGQLVLTPRFIIITAGSPALLEQCKSLAAALFPAAEPETGGKIQSGGYRDQPPEDGDNYSWPEPGYAAVAGCVRDGLEALGYGPKQQRGALKLWFDFCSKERPSIRKTAAWTATVIYTFARLEMENSLKQQDLAGRYGVASSTISARFRQLCRALELVAFDRRYSSKKPPAAGLREHPLLFRRLVDK